MCAGKRIAQNSQFVDQKQIERRERKILDEAKRVWCVCVRECVIWHESDTELERNI